jgi:hypothetical protein
MEAVSIVSVEGNWDTAINARRLDFAAAAFRRADADFIISSGTYEPGLPSTDRALVKKLGEQNADALRDLQGIDPALVIPAYAFPFEFTYTVIEAFGNACVIGWLISGFERRSIPGRVDFAPVSSGAHCERVHVLNIRACQALTQFNVATAVRRQKLSGPDDPERVEREAGKLRQLTRPGGVIATGRWFHGDEERSFDDPALMRATFAGMIKAIFPGLAEDEVWHLTGARPLAQRYAIMQMLCEVSAKRELGPLVLNRIVERTKRRFAGAFDETHAKRMAERLEKTAGKIER